jgi:hypothetical protein
MAAHTEYPVDGDPIVRGDPLTIPVVFPGETDVTEWSFRAYVRASPDGELVTAFGIEPDPDALNGILLTLDEDQTRLLQDGYGFDLEELAPVSRTWFICTAMRVERDYSYTTDEEST